MQNNNSIGNNVASEMGRGGQDLSEELVDNRDVTRASGGTFVVAKTRRRDVAGQWSCVKQELCRDERNRCHDTTSDKSWEPGMI